jgi:hypothetical protein
MSGPVWALSWQVWWRHRRGLTAALCFVIGFCGLCAALPAEERTPKFGILGSVLFLAVLVYLAAVFCFGFDCQVEARESAFPARSFTLPVRTRVLVGCPMLQGAALFASLSTAWAVFVLWPCGLGVSPGLLALLSATFLASLQALLWVPLGLPWARVVVAVPLLLTLALTPQVSLAYGVGETTLLGLYGVILLAAFGLALVGVAHARRGNLPNWGALLPAAQRAARRAPGRLRRPFASAERARLWFEWRRHGVGLPLAVGCLLALQLAFMLWLEPQRQNAAQMGINALIFPLLVAPFFGMNLGWAGHRDSDRNEISPFLAAQPVTEAAWVAGKLRAAALSALAAWGLVLVAVPVWWVAMDGSEVLGRAWDRLQLNFPEGKAVVLLGVAGVGLPLLTWRLLTDNLFVGLLGRRRAVHAGLILTAVALTVLFALLAHWMENPRFGDGLRDFLPWLAGAKLLAAAWALRAVQRRGLLRSQTVACLLAAWLVIAAGLFACLWWLLPEGFASVRVLASVVVLLVPLARLAAAPLALAWNRHR